MPRFSKKSLAVIAAAALVVVVAAGAAIAYFTAGGAGTGTATTGTVTALTAVQTSTVAGMQPGDVAQPLSGNFTNPNTGPTYVTSVTVAISSVTKDAGAVTGTCDATDYTLVAPVMTVGAEVPTGTAQGAWTGATIQFNDKATNQDQCKNATVNLAYTIA